MLREVQDKAAKAAFEAMFETLFEEQRTVTIEDVLIIVKEMQRRSVNVKWQLQGQNAQYVEGIKRYPTVEKLMGERT